MKRNLLSIAMLIVSVLSAFAVPSGVYADSRGKNRVLVCDNGDIYFLDKDGRVIVSTYVVSENTNGTFTLKDANTGATYTKNAWWAENGTIKLNMELGYETLSKVR